VSLPKAAIPGLKAEPPPRKTEAGPEGFSFEPVICGSVTDYSAFPANRIYIALESESRALGDESPAIQGNSTYFQIIEK
jgi:hypothetical protein